MVLKLNWLVPKFLLYFKLVVVTNHIMWTIFLAMQENWRELKLLLFCLAQCISQSRSYTHTGARLKAQFHDICGKYKSGNQEWTFCGINVLKIIATFNSTQICKSLYLSSIMKIMTCFSRKMFVPHYCFFFHNAHMLIGTTKKVVLYIIISRT